MRLTHGFGLLLTLLALASISTPQANAQFGGYYGGDWGSWAAVIGMNKQMATSRNLAAQAQARSAAASRQATMQMGNRIDSTLLNQANLDVQRSQMKMQDHANWWFQTEARQMAQQQQMRSFARPPMAMAAAPDTGGAAAGGPVISAQAATDLIRWPTVLMDPRFDAARAKIEAPYRRVKTEARPMTADDYLQMIATANGMKTTLKQMAGEISAAQYMATEQFLDQLIKEAEARAKAKEEASDQPEPTADPEPGKPAAAAPAES